jgi:hypothetical protein
VDFMEPNVDALKHEQILEDFQHRSVILAHGDADFRSLSSGSWVGPEFAPPTRQSERGEKTWHRRKLRYGMSLAGKQIAFIPFILIGGGGQTNR